MKKEGDEMHPKGKVAYDEHHAADKAMARMLHIAAALSAAIVTAVFLIL